MALKPSNPYHTTVGHLTDLNETMADDGGLSFPREESAFRMRTKANREAAVKSGKKKNEGEPVNPRTVIRAPKDSELPDFVTGKITPEDWIKRHEKLLKPHEIHEAASWYHHVYKNFHDFFKDPEESKKMARAWLVANQNTSVSSALANALLQREQIRRGTPLAEMMSGGLPSATEAARAVISQKPIESGVGVKISDFVDSAAAKKTRSYYGDDPKAGRPFVIDIHSARDTGLVDQKLINHLTRLGYDKKDLAKLKIDLLAGPKESQYEDRSKFGSEQLTEHLNKKKWQGRSDWNPEEVQAVGWMGMLKLTREATEHSSSALERNLRRISYEISPGEGSPWQKKYGAQLDALPEDQKRAITAKVADSAMEHASRISGVNVHGMVHGTGGWRDPSAGITGHAPAAVGQGLMSERGAEIATHVLGHLLNQTEVWHNSVKPMTKNPAGFAMDFIEKGSRNLADREYLHKFWSQLVAADPHGLIGGYQPITTPEGHVGIRALIDKGGGGTHKKLMETLTGPIAKMLEATPLHVDAKLHEAEISKARNDWTKENHGQAFIGKLQHLLGRDPTTDLHSARTQLEAELEGHLAAARAGAGAVKRSVAGGS